MLRDILLKIFCRFRPARYTSGVKAMREQQRNALQAVAGRNICAFRIGSRRSPVRLCHNCPSLVIIASANGRGAVDLGPPFVGGTDGYAVTMIELLSYLRNDSQEP